MRQYFSHQEMSYRIKGLRGEPYRLAAFAMRYPDSWHTMSRDNPEKTKRALISLEALGLVQIARYSPAARPAGNQFRLAAFAGARHAWPEGV